MAITASQAEILRTNESETERPSTSAQNVEEATSTIPPGIDKAIENSNEAEEISNFEETETSSDSDNLVPANEGAEQPTRLEHLTSKHFGDLLKYQSTIRMKEAQEVKRKYVFRYHYNMYLVDSNDRVHEPPENCIAVYME